MKKGIHPEYKPSTIVCSCGNEIETRSTEEEIHVEICSVCHPFYTGRQKLVDTAGRVERFQRKYGDTSLSGQEVEEEAEQEGGAEESTSEAPSGAADSEEAASEAEAGQPRKIPADSPEEESAEEVPQGASGEEGAPETEGEA